MFASINFLFLISLAVTSWIILCYFKQIEEQRLGDTRQHYTMERTFDDNLAPCRNNYDIYLNFLCIFACVYALAKVTQLTEGFVAHRMRSRFSGAGGSSLGAGAGAGTGLGRQQSHSAEDHRAQKEHLVRQVELLQQQNEQLEHRLQELLPRSPVDADRMLGTGELQKQLLGCYKMAASTVAASSCVGDGGSAHHNTNSNNNIFISNRHFHVNRQVFVDDDCGGIGKAMGMGVGLGGLGKSSPLAPCPALNFSPSWQKYLELQKFAIQTMPSTSTASLPPSKEVPANPMPIVVSTEELQTIQGLF